jgi:putative addiction module killer protein
MNIRSAPQFDDWFFGLAAHDRAHIYDRFDRICEHNHFGDKKYLGDALFELRWKNGRRVYYALVKDSADNAALMLLGGSKNGQERDVALARKILGRKDD